MPISLSIIILTILEVQWLIKVIRGQIIVVKGHVVQNRKKVVTYDTSGAHLSFNIHLTYVPKC